MTKFEMLAILRFLEETRAPGLDILGVDARDPIWMMSIALLRRHYSNQSITISSLAQSSGAARTTALRQIDRMLDSGLVERRQDRRSPKLVFIEPTDRLLRNFHEYCLVLKRQIGAVFGLGHSSEGAFVFGAAHLSARIIGGPTKLTASLGMDGPLRLLIKDETTFKVLTRMTSEMSVFLGIPIEYEMLAYEDLYAKVVANSRAADSAYDIIALDIPWLGRMAIEGALHPFDQELQRSRLNPFDFYAAAWEGGRCRGRQFGIPFSPTAELLLYRTDIFEAHGLAPPSSPQDVLRAAEAVHAPNDGLYGIAWNAARGQPMGQTFIQVMAAFGSPPVNLQRNGAGYDLNMPWEDLRPSLDNEAGEATLDYLQRLVRFSPPDIKVMDWTARGEAYRHGSAAMCYEWSTRTMSFESDQESPARGATGYLPHPSHDNAARISPMGGWVLSIPSNIDPSRRRGAWRALQWLVSPEMSKCLIQNGSPAKFLHSVSADPEVAEMQPVFSIMDSMEKRGQLQIWPRPPIPFMTSMMRIVGEEIHDVIWGQSSQKTVLRRIEDRLSAKFETLTSAEPARDKNDNTAYASDA